MESQPKISAEAADIFRRLEALDLTQRQLASALGLEDNKVSKTKKGERQFKAPEVLKAREWLAAHEEGPVPDDGEEGEPDHDIVDIQEWDIAYGMGGGTDLDLPVKMETRQFSRAWLRMFTHAPPSKIFLATGTGDSMMPTILDADIVLIDTSENQIRMGDRIWAISYGNAGYIKRLRPMPDGGVKILSDNPSVGPETAYDGEMSVVGRVVAIVRKT